jgi:ribonuclease HI
MTTYHLYSDGNYFPRAKKSGFGGYIRNPEGEILVEYTEHIKQIDYIFNFELLGIIRGLEIAQSMGIEHLVSHCDEKTTVGRLKEIMEIGKGNVDDIPLNAKPELFQEIVNLSKSFKSISFAYIPRNLNKHSDTLSRRYSLNMEKNFLFQYSQELNHSEKVFNSFNTPTKKAYFSHSKMVRMDYKNNPFLVAPIRNKKIRKTAKIEQLDNYEFIFIESFKDEKKTTFKSFHYDEKKNKKLLNEIQFDSTDNHLEKYCHILDKSLKNMNCEKIWINSNCKSFNDFFEQKEKVSVTNFQIFKKIHNTLNQFNKILFNNFPFDHEFSIEISIQEQEKKFLKENIETLDILIEQLQNVTLDKDRKKAFGMLVRHHLRNYKVLLERDLNEIEKHDIIQKTTDDLTAQGFTELPNIKKIKM